MSTLGKGGKRITESERIAERITSTRHLITSFKMTLTFLEKQTTKTFDTKEEIKWQKKVIASLYTDIDRLEKDLFVVKLEHGKNG